MIKTLLFNVETVNEARPGRGKAFDLARAIVFMTCFGIVCYVGHSKHSD